MVTGYDDEDDTSSCDENTETEARWGKIQSFYTISGYCKWHKRLTLFLHLNIDTVFCSYSCVKI